MAGDAAAGLSVLGGRRVLVTGHTGFKGSWLAQWLCDLGAEVTGLALAPATDPNLCDVLGLAGRLTDCRGDVRSPEIVVREVDRARPDVIFHLAAQAIVRAAYPEPAATFATNVMGTVHLLDAVRTLGRPCAVVVVTSDKCATKTVACAGPTKRTTLSAGTIRTARAKGRPRSWRLPTGARSSRPRDSRSTGCPSRRSGLET